MNAEHTYADKKIDPLIYPNIQPEAISESFDAEISQAGLFIKTAQSLLEEGVFASVSSEMLDSIAFHAVSENIFPNDSDIIDQHLKEEYYRSTRDETVWNESFSFTSDQRQTLRTRCVLRIYISIQQQSLDELKTIKSYLHQDPHGAEATLFVDAYKNFYEAQERKELETLRQEIASKEGRMLGSWGMSELETEEAALESILHQKREAVDNAQDVFQKSFFFALLQEKLSAMRLGRIESTESIQQLSQQSNNVIFQRLRGIDSERGAAKENLERSFHFISSIYDGTLLEETGQTLNNVEDVIRDNQDKNKIVEMLVQGGGEGIKQIVEWTGGPDMLIKMIDVNVMLLSPFKTTDEHTGQNKEYILGALKELFSVFEKDGNKELFQRFKILVDAAASYPGPSPIGKFNTLESVLLSSKQSTESFSKADLQRPFEDVLKEHQTSYQSIIDEYIHASGQIQQQFLLNQHLGIHSSGRFSTDPSWRAKIQGIPVFNGMDPFRQMRRYMPFGSVLGIDKIKLQSYEKRKESFVDIQDQLAEGGDAMSFLVSTIDESGAFVREEKFWSDMTDIEKEFVCQKECQYKHDFAHIESGWENEFFQDHPFVAFSGQVLVADTMISTTPVLARMGYVVVKSGGEICLGKGLFVGARILKNSVSPSFYKGVGREMAKIAPRISVLITKKIHQTITNRVLQVVAKKTTEAMVKIGAAKIAATSANVVPVAGQVISGLSYLAIAYAGYSVGEYFLRSKKVTEALNDINSDATDIDFDDSTQAFVDLYMDKNLPPDATEDQIFDAYNKALMACPKAQYRVTGKDGRYIDCTFSHGEPVRLVLWENGEKTELDLTKNPDFEQDLEAIDVQRTEDITLLAGFTQLKLNIQSNQVIEVERFDGDESMWVVKNKNNTWSIDGYSSLSFENDYQAILMANLINLLGRIARNNPVTNKNPFYISRGRLMYDDKWVFDTKYVEKETIDWYKKQTDIDEQQLVDALNHFL